ncbi:23759_t:CDS:2, partial [Gigaspora rosea]
MIAISIASYLDFSDRHRDLENSKLRVYAKTAVHNCVIHKMLVCALRGKERKDIILSKETVLELLEITQEVNETAQMYLGDEIYLNCSILEQ